MKHSRFWIPVVLIFFWACHRVDKEPNVVVKGTFPILQRSLVFLEELEPRGTVLLDSTITSESGEFQFRFHAPAAGFYLLRSKNQNTLVLQLDPGQEVLISGPEGLDEGKISLTGSPGSLQILEFDRFLAQEKERIDSLGMVYQSTKGSPGFNRKKDELDSAYRSLVKEHRDYVLDFISGHPSSLVGLLMINRKMGNATVFDEKEDFMVFYQVDSLLQKHHPENKHAKDHHERVRTLRGEIFDDYVMEEKLRPGKKAPDIVLPDTSGHPVSLKEFTGQTVLLYFWAGWDAPSRRDNRVLASVYPSLKKKNIEILGISLDENEVIWEGAVRLDGLSWPQVSELKGFYAQVKKDYHIPDDLPFYYIVGPDQRIRYKHDNLDSVLVRLN